MRDEKQETRGDLLEAEAKRENAQPGNAAAMREALESTRNWCLNRLGNASSQVTVEGLLSVVNAALAAPQRNCDVGTPEEQIKRWEEFCIAHHEYWKPRHSLTNIQRCFCPCLQGNSCNYFIWAQMPYEAQEGGKHAKQ